MMFLRSASRTIAAAAVLALALPSSAASAQDGIIAGVVFDQATKVGLDGVEVRVLGTKLRAITGPSGRYEFRSVEPGLYEVEGRRVGYMAYRDDSVDVQPGNVTKAYLVLRPVATLLENVVTTGDGVDGDKLTVPARDAAQSIQGKVAGVSVSGSGLPGTEMMIQLRTATSIRGNRPLIIVDGVTLATAQASTLDISTMDIRSVEILKGAAASAAYGARGAAGVIIIRTNRGRQ
jgi:TonB-dependent SusC/RagA subfamily outer membrane receptor